MRGMTLPSGTKIVLCDTVGFISDLPTELVASFRATLEEISEADVVLHVHDAASAELTEQSQTVRKILVEIVGETPPKIYNVLNKIDLIHDEVVTNFIQFTSGNSWLYMFTDHFQSLSSKLTCDSHSFYIFRIFNHKLNF